MVVEAALLRRGGGMRRQGWLRGWWATSRVPFIGGERRGAGSAVVGAGKLEDEL